MISIEQNTSYGRERSQALLRFRWKTSSVEIECRKLHENSASSGESCIDVSLSCDLKLKKRFSNRQEAKEDEVEAKETGE